MSDDAKKHERAFDPVIDELFDEKRKQSEGNLKELEEMLEWVKEKEKDLKTRMEKVKRKKNDG